VTDAPPSSAEIALPDSAISPPPEPASLSATVAESAPPSSAEAGAPGAPVYPPKKLPLPDSPTSPTLPAFIDHVCLDGGGFVALPDGEPPTAEPAGKPPSIANVPHVGWYQVGEQADKTPIMRFIDVEAGVEIATRTREGLEDQREGVRRGVQHMEQKLATIPSVDATDIVILETLLRNASYRLMQHQIKSRAKEDICLRTIADRMPDLEHDGLVARPRKKKLGYVITPRGCEVLKSLGYGG
jgi:hypothetical protein